MLTFSQRKQQAAKLCGINYLEPEMEIIISNLNMADKLFENAARRSWTRKEKIAKLTAGKQYYQIASDMHRVSSVRCKTASNGDVIVPLKEVQSEYEWNKLNSYPFEASYPTHYFIRGNDEIGIYPCPSETINDGLIVSYEPRIRDMGIDDFTFTADVVQNGVNITNPDNTGLPGGFKPYMTENFWIKSNNAEDGNWYKVQKVIDTNTMQIDNNYLGPSGTGVSFTMGQVPPYPEEYHEAPIYYAAFKFFAMRKDTDSSAMYRTLFEDALDQYRETYGSKTTGGVINPGCYDVPNISDVFKMSKLTEGL
jgi:hypothetical protein